MTHLSGPARFTEVEPPRVTEVEHDGLLRLVHWESQVSRMADDQRLVCGITLAETGDFGLQDRSSCELEATYSSLAHRLGFQAVSVPRQIHGTDVAEVLGTPPAHAREPRVFMAGDLDGQVTSRRGILLAATAADCVPVYLWVPSEGRIGLVHAGWRGVAAGILVKALYKLMAPEECSSEVVVHLGPSICGACYEVDTPVLSALGLPGTKALVSLRSVLTKQALAAGVLPENVSASSLCTACEPVKLHSHRASGGKAGRMAAFLGIAKAIKPKEVEV